MPYLQEALELWSPWRPLPEPPAACFLPRTELWLEPALQVPRDKPYKEAFGDPLPAFTSDQNALKGIPGLTEETAPGSGELSL